MHGALSRETLERIRRFESPNVTHLDEREAWPVVWERARGCDVWDVEGRRFLDLTAAFGVAAAGHANPRVVAAGRRQMGRLLHGMGDVHPHAAKGLLLEMLSARTFGRWKPGLEGRAILACTGSDAVEAALKTAMLATGRRGVVAFEGAYHGTGYGALNATHREHFRRRFEAQLGGFVGFVEGGRMDALDPMALPGLLDSVERRVGAAGRFWWSRRRRGAASVSRARDS